MKKFALMLTAFFILINCSYGKKFFDVEDHWASNVINEWTNNGIMSGYNDGTFRPNSTITKAELVTILNKINNDNQAVNKRPSKDVKLTDWYCADMAIALKNDLIKLDKNGELNPKSLVTREDALVMISKLFNLRYSGDSTKLLSKFSDYQDMKVENIPYVSGMVYEGYVIGDNGKLNLTKEITRAELVAMLDRVIERIHTNGQIKNTSIKGNLIINGNNVTLSNVQVEGHIYLLKGAKDGIVNFNNVYASKGIESEFKNVISYNDGTKPHNNLSNIKEERETAEIQFVRIEYSETDWTNESVTATLKFDNKDMKIINNKGKNKYKFTKNGEFTFVCVDENDNEYRYTAKVDNIAKKDLEIELNIQDNISNAIVTVNILKNEAPIKDMRFIAGNESIEETLESGEKIINNQFTVTDTNTYTVAVEDEAGNTTRAEFNWKNTAKHMIQVIQNKGGKITPDSKEVKHHENASFNVLVNTEEGYYLYDVLVDGVSQGLITEYTFEDIKDSHTIEAVFKLHTYNIEVIQAPNGKIEPKMTEMEFGTTQTFRITPDEGYVIKDVLVDGQSVGAVSTYDLINVREVHTITAVFEIIKYNIIVDHSTNGTITPGTTLVEYGSEITFFIQPDTGYEIKDVVIDNISIGPNLSYTFKEVKGSHIIVAIFEEIPHTGILEKTQIGENVYATIYDDLTCTIFGLGKTNDFTYPFIEDKHPLGEYGRLIKKVNVKLGVKNIGDALFAECSSLQFVDLPVSVEVFGGNAFRNCEALKEIVIPETQVEIESRMFYNCKSLESIIIPDSVRLIGIEAFSGCSSIETITMPKNLEEIAAKAFYNCKSLIDNIAIPEGTRKIGENVFYGCDLLASVTLPKSVESIGKNTFNDCSILKSITFTNRRKIDNLGREWLPNGGEYKENVVGNNYVITRTSFTITVVKPVHGIIEPETVNVKKQTNKKFRMIPENGYEVEDVIVDGVSMGALDEYEFTSVNRTHTITANFKPADYEITYDLDGGMLLAENPQRYNPTMDSFKLNNPVKTGYEFAGWIGTGLDVPTIDVTISKGEFGDKEFTATWNVVEYVITYELSGGIADNPITYTIDTPDIILNEPTKSGYEFIGWKIIDTDTPNKGVVIARGSTGDKKYIAAWNPINYTITYKLNNGEFAEAPITTYNIESYAFTLLEPSRLGYTFTGWTGEGLTVGTYSVTIPTGSTGDRTYYANWQATWYTIEYDLADGINSVDNPSGYTVLTPNIELKQPTKDGYEFVGWIEEGDATVKPNVTITIGSTGNKKFKAIWRTL